VVAVILTSPIGNWEPATLLAASTQPTPRERASTPAPDRGRAQPAQAVPIDLRDAGGRGGSGGSAEGAGRAAVELSPTHPRVTPPTAATRVPALANAYSTTTANPDGTNTIRASTNRINFQDPSGSWLPIDLALIDDPAGPYALRAVANDRTVRFGTTDASTALAQLASGTTAITLRAIDFPSTLTAGGPAGVAPSTAPSASPVPSPTSAPVASAGPDATAVANPSPATPSSSTDASSPSPSSEPAPSVSVSPSPSATPTPSATPSPSASPTPSGAPAVYKDNRLVFTDQSGSGLVVVQPTVDGFEFGAIVANSAKRNVYAFALDPGGLVPTLDADGQTIVLSQVTFTGGDLLTSQVGWVSPPVIRDANDVPASQGAVTVELYQPGQATMPAGVDPTALAAIVAPQIGLIYTVDPLYLADPTRAFPVTLDPTTCLSTGQAKTCTLSGTASGAFDHFVQSHTPSAYPSGWNVFRVGYDVRTDDGVVYDKMRGLAYFPDVALPDGAVVYNADLALHESSVYGGGSGNPISAYRIIDKDGWSTTETWQKFGTGTGTSGNGDGYTTTGGVSTNSDVAGTTMHWDVDTIVQSWYTRRGKDWTADLGFAIKMATESTDASSGGEVEFDRSDDATAAYRPTLVITYDTPHVSIDFATALGQNYAPATMVAGQATTLPILVSNNGSGFDFTTANYKVGYRWFDEKSALVGAAATQSLPQCVGTGTGCTSPVSVSLAVTPPATPGSYTLRLDLVHLGTNNAFASDYASPSKYYSRNKKVLTSDNTRWTGSSVIERDDFGITVVGAGGTAGETESVATGEGGSLGLNLYTHDLTYDGSGGVAFSDLVSPQLEYGYDAKLTSDCTGILDACGWWTSYDERFVAGTNIGDYTYQDPSGGRQLVSDDANGQLVSGASVLLAHPRTTLFDENGPSTGSVTLAQPGFGAYSGASALKMLSTTAASVATNLPNVRLNNQQWVSFAVRTDGALGVGVDFKVHDVTDTSVVDQWIIYTVGTDFTTCCQKIHLKNGAVDYNIVNNWAYISQRSLYGDARNLMGAGTYDELQLTAFEITGWGAGAPGTNSYVDAVHLESGNTTVIDEQNPAWTGFSTFASEGAFDPNPPAPANVLRVTQQPIASSPDCASCLGTGGFLGVYPFMTWSWKKVGGGSAALILHLTDIRSTTTCDLTYYAGPAAPPGAPTCNGNPAAIQVSDTVPTGWTRVTRDVLDDARQALNFFNDSAGTSSPSAPPVQGPTADDVRWTGFRISAVDGAYLLVDNLGYHSLPDIGPGFGQVSVWNANPANLVFDDFQTTSADGSIHTFNRDGLLTRIGDRDGNILRLDWTFDPAQASTKQGAYTLTSLHAPSDGTLSGSTTFTRRIDLSTPGSPSGTRAIAFTERLGSTANPITGRSTVFTISTTTGDIVTIQPARTPTCGTRNPATGTGSGCIDFTYTAHQLTLLADPRWDNTMSGSKDLRWEVTWSGTDPTAILDHTAASTPVLKVLTYAATGSISPASTRAVWQDAAAGRAGAAIATDLTSDGRVLSETVPVACSPSSCSTLPTFTASQHRVEHQFDGIARVSTEWAFRCPGVAVPNTACTGTTAERVVSRQATKAGSKVDNYSDPLTAGELAWSQTPDQYLSSLADSGGGDQDLYRTTYTYDEYGRQTAAATPVRNARPDYQRAVTSTTRTTAALTEYWCLGEASGATAANVANPAHTGTYTNGVGLGATGALVNDANTAATFDGSNDHVTINGPIINQTGYTIEAWVKASAAGQTNRGLAGQWSGSGAFLWLDAGGFYTLVHAGSATYLHSSITPRVGSWDHVVGTWDGAIERLYVNGAIVAQAATLTAPGQATTNFEIGTYGTGNTGWYFAGQIDEVALYSQALTSNQVADHVLAAHAIALEQAGTSYDAQWHRTQSDDQSLASPGFESGAADWELAAASGSGVYTATGSGDPLVHSGFSSFKTGLGGSAQQDVQLLPGQTFRAQAWGMRSTTAISGLITISYWGRTGASWINLVNQTATSTAGSWQSWAWDLVLPFDTDGRVRIAFTSSGGGGSDEVYFDDVAILTSYIRSTFNTNGTPDTAFTFTPSTLGVGTTVGEFQAKATYAPDTAASGFTTHPAIWPTTTIADYVNGIYDPLYPDEDATSTATYDAWGRSLVRTDPDGVSSTAGYDLTSGTNGYLTDVTATSVGVDDPSTTAFDLVGNPITQTTPNHEATQRTYDLSGHLTSVIDPAAVKTLFKLDNYGFKIADIANDIDEIPSGAGGLDDVITAYTYDALGNTIQIDADCGQISPSVNCTANGGLDARTVTASDLLGNQITTTVYPGSGGTGTARTTTNYVEVIPASGAYVGRPRPSAVRGPLAPPSGAPTCPDQTVSVVCTSAAVMPGAVAGSIVSGIDLAGRPMALKDAYGKIARTFSDLSGRTVFSIADYVDGVYDPTVPDADIVTATQYHLSGPPEITIGVRRYTADAHDPTIVNTIDKLGRVTAVTTNGTDGAAVNAAKTVYTAGGRVDRASAADDDAHRSWTKTVYDLGGRAIKTLAQDDPIAAGLTVDSFEGPSTLDRTITNDGIAEHWDNAAGTFIAAGASLTEDHAAALAKSGNSTLNVGPAATGEGAEWKLDGKFMSGQSYRSSVWVNAPTGTTVRVRFGTASDPATALYADVAGNGLWQRATTASWAPGGDQTGVVLAAYDVSGTGAFKLDDAVVWNTGTPDLSDPTSETVYDPNGAIVATVTPPGVPGTDEPLVTTTTRDALGRPMAITVNAIAGNGTGDSTSNLATTTHYDALGRTDYSLDPLIHKTSFGFDRLGRATATTVVDMGSTPTAATDDHDVKSTFGYDALGELTAYCPAAQVILFAGGTPCSPTAGSGEPYDRGWHWTYDVAGERTSEIPPVNTVAAALDSTVWAYDGGGRQTSVTSQSLGGTVHRHTDVVSRDALGRVTSAIAYQGTGTATPKIRTDSSWLGDGQQASVTTYLDGSSTASDGLTFTYDLAGRPDQLKRGATILTDNAWNPDGTLAQRADGDGGAIGTSSFTYDWAKRLTGATLPSGWQTGANTASFAYRTDGLLASRTWNGSANPLTFSYDAAKRPLQATKSLTSGSITLTQAYDRGGNVTAEGRIFPAAVTGDAGGNSGNPQTFTYDRLNRVKTSTGLASGAHQYSYDLDSNRLSKTDGADSFVAVYDRTDELTSVSKNGGFAVTASEDTYGNLLADPEAGTTAGVITYAYDLADRTISMTTSGTLTTLTLDALGRNWKRTTAGSTDTYSYAGTTNAVVRIANTGGGGATTDSIVDPAGDRLGTKTGGTVAWLVPDLHGSIAAGLSQDTLSVTDAIRYDGFGQTVATWPVGGSPATKSWKYQGRLDVSPTPTSLYDLAARDYAPGLGAFTSLDSVVGSAQNPMELNRFLYAEGSPTTLVDPDGHCTGMVIDGMLCQGASAKNVNPATGKATQPNSSPTCTKKCKAHRTPTGQANKKTPSGKNPDAVTPTDGLATDKTGYRYDPSDDRIPFGCKGADDIRACVEQFTGAPINFGVQFSSGEIALPGSETWFTKTENWIEVDVTTASTYEGKPTVTVGADGAALSYGDASFAIGQAGVTAVGVGPLSVDAGGHGISASTSLPFAGSPKVSVGGYAIPGVKIETWTTYSSSSEGKVAGVPATVEVEYSVHRRDTVKLADYVVIPVVWAVRQAPDLINRALQTWESCPACL